MPNNKKPKLPDMYVDKDKIMHIKFYRIKDSAIQEEQAKYTVRESNKILDAYPGKKMRAVIDVRESLKVFSRARKIYGTFLKDKRIGKVAFFGVNTVMKVVLSFIMAFSGKKNTKIFKTEEECLEWLKQS